MSKITRPRHLDSLITALILLSSWIVMFRGYERPNKLFWDENYHIASAQKYLNSIFFMEPHPPLGKLIVAAGEWVLKSNERDDQFINTDKASNLPVNFSFAGYRFFPVLLGALCPILLYLCFRILSVSPIFSGLTATLFLLDNSLVLHLRGAMLEGPQLFFLLINMFAVFGLAKASKNHRYWALLWGVSFALVMTTKVNGLILGLFFPVALWVLWKKNVSIFSPLAYASIAAFLIYISVWQVHFANGKNISPELPSNGFYKASPELRKAIETHQQASPRYFLLSLTNSFNFTSNYADGVQTTNLCKQSENGSPAWLWPIGGRSISYRWERKGNTISYMYLQSNPIVFGCALIGIVFGIGVLVARCLHLSIPPVPWVGSLTFAYLSYMAIMLQFRRVMYLYHYFIPLVFGLLIFGIIVGLAPTLFYSKRDSHIRIGMLACVVILAATVFNYFSPLTYGTPYLSESELKKRAWLGVWDLHCPSCDLTNTYARPVCDPNLKLGAAVEVSGIRGTNVFQEWGEPRMGKSVDGADITSANGQKSFRSIGVHARSSMKFQLGEHYSRFIFNYALTDQNSKDGKGGSVAFVVRAEGREIWNSGTVRTSSLSPREDVPLEGVKELVLEVLDAGDGNSLDHAAWIEPIFEK